MRASHYSRSHHSALHNRLRTCFSSHAFRVRRQEVSPQALMNPFSPSLMQLQKSLTHTTSFSPQHIEFFSLKKVAVRLDPGWLEIHAHGPQRSKVRRGYLPMPASQTHTRGKPSVALLPTDHVLQNIHSRQPIHSPLYLTSATYSTVHACLLLPVAHTHILSPLPLLHVVDVVKRGRWRHRVHDHLRSDLRSCDANEPALRPSLSSASAEIAFTAPVALPYSTPFAASAAVRARRVSWELPANACSQQDMEEQVWRAEEILHLKARKLSLQRFVILFALSLES